MLCMANAAAASPAIRRASSAARRYHSDYKSTALTTKVPRAVKWDPTPNLGPYDLVSSRVCLIPATYRHRRVQAELGTKHNTKLFVCYFAVTALTERFCQNAPRLEANGGQVQGLRLAGPTWPPTNYSCRDHGVRRRRTARRRAGTAAAGSPRMNWGLATDLIGLPVVGFGRNRGNDGPTSPATIGI